ncbi:MAG: ribonuclease HI [Sphaerochaetaceae bacterium]|nr:ribonuclease HI [Sphaerochaetaceae bacterium]
MDTITIYTDGGCSGNPGPGGWAYVVSTEAGIVASSSGGDKQTTNNRMELTAVIEALRFVYRAYHPDSVTLCTDSQYVRQGITSWIHNWKKNGWKTANKKPVKNKDLWQVLDKAREYLSIEWVWVKGHSGIELNEMCDSLVSAEMDTLKKQR